MSSKSKLVIGILAAILLVTNVVTGYMFYEQKTGIIAQERKTIIALEVEINNLKKERKDINYHLALIVNKYDSLIKRKNEITIINSDLVNYVTSLSDSAKATNFIQQLQDITKKTNN